MEDLQKVNSLQLYSFWKSLSIGLLVVIGMMTFSRLLPFYTSPIIGVISSGILYGMLYNQQRSSEHQCMVVIYALLHTIINYTVVTIILNVLTIWDVIKLPDEFLFINDPYIPSLLLNPIAFITVLFIYLRRNRLKVCSECKLREGGLYERGRNGKIFRYESAYLLKNLIFLFGFLTAIVWSYYQFIYIELSVNSRDWYVFVWLYIIAFVIDELYFVYRYYNLYLDLKESNEIISQEELQDMTAKTYLRYYVICDNSIFLDQHTIDSYNEHREVINTPFVTKRTVNGIPLPEVKMIIQKLTGVKDGELRFFYGRKSADLTNHSVLRYFYFLPGKPEDYPDIPLEGEWMDFEEVKRIYSQMPGRFNSMAIADLSRLATIILTNKIFNEEGKRRNKIKSYHPSFNLHDVRKSELDFQDDKWIKISVFNSDTPFYSIKKFFRGKLRAKNG